MRIGQVGGPSLRKSWAATRGVGQHAACAQGGERDEWANGWDHGLIAGGSAECVEATDAVFADGACSRRVARLWGVHGGAQRTGGGAAVRQGVRAHRLG